MAEVGKSPRIFEFPRALIRWMPVLIVIGLALLGLANWMKEAWGWQIAWLSMTLDTASNFSAVFLGIFIEAAPYLLMGTLASGLVETFLNADDLAKLVPRNRLGGILMGSVLGLFFPVCECGTVPLARRLIRKGLPVPVGVTFLLAAPVINPIVIASTLAAFGDGKIFWLRLILTLVIAVGTGLIFLSEPDPARVMRTSKPAVTAEAVDQFQQDGVKHQSPISQRIKQVLVVTGDEFFEMGRYLVIGALLAALMQTILPQSWLLAIGEGPVLSVIMLALLAVLLSICSTVDSFIALAFTGIFSSGAILAFLVYGPMVDIKSTLMYLRVFRARTVAYLVVIPLVMTLVAGVILNIWVG